ncbi:hypothetical protein BV22DRAFT_1052728, partial [Leucogyrophana mollusca]
MNGLPGAQWHGANIDAGALIALCSVEVVHKVCGFLDVRDISMYGATARQNYIAMHHYLSDERVIACIRPFLPKPCAFVDVMRTHGCAISGSVALYYFDPTRGWAPVDMDIYVPRWRIKRVLNYLVSAGYAPVDRPNEHRTHYGAECGMAEVVTLSNGKR